MPTVASEVAFADRSLNHLNIQDWMDYLMRAEANIHLYM